jgi:hypothetical protein
MRTMKMGSETGLEVLMEIMTKISMKVRKLSFNFRIYPRMIKSLLIEILKNLCFLMEFH